MSKLVHSQVAPHSQESEMIVLGCMLTSINSLNIGAEALDDADFFFTEHRLIFQVLKTSYCNSQPADIHLISEELKRLDKLKVVGGISYLTALAQYAGTSAYIEEYVELVRNRSILRGLLNAAQNMHQGALDDPEDVESLINDCFQKLQKIKDAAKPKQKIPLKFISEMHADYFNKAPSEKPRLLYFVENQGGKTTFLHKEIVAMLVGEGGRGKSHLLALLAACVATGIPFLDVFEIEKPGSVCLLVGENNDSDIHRLLFKIHHHLVSKLKKNADRRDGNHFGLHFENPLEHLSKNLIPVTVHGMNAHFIDENGKVTPFFNDLLYSLKQKAFPGGFQLVILDPASRFAGPQAEKDNAIATDFIACLERISLETPGNPTILLSHHKSKSAIREGEASQTDSRGSSGLTDGCRLQASLSKGESSEYSIIQVTKTNFTAYPKPIIVKKGKDGVPEFDKWGEEAQEKKTAPVKKNKQKNNSRWPNN